jgi:hypothetical protein
VDPERLFAKEPPREPLTSLDAIVRDWQWRFIEGDAKRHRDEVVEFCRDASDLPDAIWKACRSRRPNGKMHNHQSKVKEEDRMKFAAAILRFFAKLRWEPTDFDELYDGLVEVRPKGIGPVTTYDVATRIGAHLGIEPESLYLHAGVMAGWKALELPVRKEWGGRVPREAWPEDLRVLPADQVEDLLCCYRALLPGVVER